MLLGSIWESTTSLCMDYTQYLTWKSVTHSVLDLLSILAFLLLLNVVKHGGSYFNAMKWFQHWNETNILMSLLFMLPSRIIVVALLYSKWFTVVKQTEETPRCNRHAFKVGQVLDFSFAYKATDKTDFRFMDRLK